MPRPFTNTRPGGGSSTSATRRSPRISRSIPAFLTRTGYGGSSPSPCTRSTRNRVHPEDRAVLVELPHLRYVLPHVGDDELLRPAVLPAAQSTQIRFEGIVANEVFAGRRFDESGVGFRIQTQITKQVNIYGHIRRWGKAYYDPAAPYQGYGTSSFAEVLYQPADKLDFLLDLTYSDFYRTRGPDEGLRLHHPPRPQHLPAQQISLFPRHRRVQPLLQAADARRARLVHLHPRDGLLRRLRLGPRADRVGPAVALGTLEPKDEMRGRKRRHP